MSFIAGSWTPKRLAVIFLLIPSLLFAAPKAERSMDRSGEKSASKEKTPQLVRQSALESMMAIPATISFQALVRDGAGEPVADGNHDVTFRIYDAPTEGSALWSETQTLESMAGVISAELGSQTPFMGSLMFDMPYFISVQLGTDPEFSPRIPLSSAPYAFTAQRAGKADSAMYAMAAQLSDSATYAMNAMAVDSASVAGWAAWSDSSDFAYMANMSIYADSADFADSASVSNNAVYADVAGNAYSAGAASYSNLTGAVQDTANLNVASVTATNFYGDGSGLTNVSTSSSAWGLTGNSGLTEGTHFVGTTSDINLQFRVNNTVAGTYYYGSTTNSYTAGVYNILEDGVQGAAILSGGTSANKNNVYDSFGVIAGGYGNAAGSDDGVIGTATSATISGGAFNTASEDYSTVGGGSTNSSSEAYATVSGGQGNLASGQYTTVAGGTNNQATGTASSIGGGELNRTFDNTGTVGGGRNNAAGSNDADPNSAPYVTIGGGLNNIATDTYSTIGGGTANEATQDIATIGGGSSNTASGYASTVGGGIYNDASGLYATVPGGYKSAARGGYSAAIGGGAKANHDFSFVFNGNGGSDSDTLSTTALGQFLIGAPGGVGIGTNSPDEMLDVDGDITADSIKGLYFVGDGGGLTNLNVPSDINLKHNFVPVSADEILDEVIRLDIQRWSYKSDDPAVQHIGPIAQDWYSSFRVGDRNTRIDVIDMNGVAMAAIQALASRNQKLEQRVAALESQRSNVTRSISSNASNSSYSSLEAENTELRSRVAKLERMVDALVGASGDNLQPPSGGGTGSSEILPVSYSQEEAK